MPETIRTANERLRSRPRRGGFLAAFVFATLCIAFSTPARAGADAADGLIDDVIRIVTAVSRQQVAALTLTLGLLCLAVLAIIVLMRTRKAAATIETAAHDESMALRAEIDRLKTLLLSEPQVLVAWAAGTDEPEIFGDTGIVVSGAVPERVLAFGSWLEPAAAQRMEHAVETLRSDGRGFVMTLTTSAGRPLEADGRAVAGRAVLRLRDVSGIEARAHGSGRPPRPADGRRRHHEGAAQFAARPGVGARPGRPADLREFRLRARGGSRGCHRCGGARAGTARPRRARKPRPRARRRRSLFRTAAGHRRRPAPHLRRGGRAERRRQRRHGDRRHRGGGHARRARAHDRGAPPRARPAGHRRRHLQRRPQAHLLQRRLPLAVRSRCRLARPDADR